MGISDESKQTEGVDVVGLDHVQLAMPVGGEDGARHFYRGLLGLSEVTKPAPLAARGGCWFAGPGIDLHLGVAPDFRPSRKAHIAILVADLAAAREALSNAGVVTTDEDVDISVARFYANDPFGNRLEFVAASDRGFSRRAQSP